MLVSVHKHIEVMSAISSHSPLNISETARDRGLVPKDHRCGLGSVDLGCFLVLAVFVSLWLLLSRTTWTSKESQAVAAVG